MKSLIPSLVVGLLTLLGVWVIQHPPTVQTYAAAPNASWLLYAVLAVAALPFAQDFATAWWKRARGTLNAGKGAVAVIGQRVGGGWKQAAMLLVVGVAIGWIAGGAKFPSIDWPSLPNIPNVIPSIKADRVVYVYEKDSGGIPSGVAAGLSKLNAAGIVATAFEEDTTDGSGETPEQYKLAKEAATKAGLPALVVQAGGTVLRVVKGPTTEQHVTEAAQ
jgi:hypothetical protein